jgi:hypothetical protein
VRLRADAAVAVQNALGFAPWVPHAVCVAAAAVQACIKCLTFAEAGLRRVWCGTLKPH